MLHIIGLNHRAQAITVGEEPTKEHRKFSECLLKTIDEVRPTLIAEEDSEETLQSRNAVSIAKSIAADKGIEHRFCDPTQAERQVIGYRDGQLLELRFHIENWNEMSDDEVFCKARAIEIGRYFPVRERFWMARLNGVRDIDAIFVCGDFHIEAGSFTNILETEGMPYRIVERGIGATKEDARYKQALEYLAEHPELANWVDPLEVGEA